MNIQPTLDGVLEGEVYVIRFSRQIKMSRTNRIGIRLCCFPSSTDAGKLRNGSSGPEAGSHHRGFSVSIISVVGLKGDRLQLVLPPKSDRGDPPFAYRLPKGAMPGPHDVRSVETVSILGKSRGGLITSPECYPSDFTKCVDFLTGELATLGGFCGWPRLLRK